MALEPRSLASLSAAIRAAIRLELPGTDALPWPNSLGVIQKVFAAALHEVDMRLQWLFRQIFASTADGPQLERHGNEYAMARKQASRATGYIEATGSADTIYPAGIAWVSAGGLYLTSGDARSDENGAVLLPVHADLAGSAGNREAGETFTLADVALYPSLSAQGAAASGGIGGGSDIETDESLRARILDRKRRPPQGGAESDYEQWALAVPGVYKAWARRFAGGPGTVGVWFLFEGRPNGIPTPADVAVVQDTLDRMRLIRAAIIVSAPIAYPVNIRIGGLSNDSSATRAAISASLAAMFASRADVGVASSPALFSRSWIGEAISQAIGEDVHRLELPDNDFVFSDGSIPVLGTITHV